MDSQSKVAIVTGAGTGIGKSAALALLGDGYRVGLVGRRKELLDKTVQDAGPAAANTLVLPADIGRPESVKALFAQVRKAWGRLDLLFNNAGMGAPAIPMEDLSFEQWQAVVDVNLSGMFLCSQEAIRIMKSQEPRGGRIINNGSISAHAPRPNSAPYTATKHAVTGLTKCISLDCRKYDIACGQIDIGNAATEMTERMKNGVAQANGSIAIEPRMDVAHVGSAILYMARLPLDANVQFMTIMARLPLDANVQFMTIMATQMPFVGRG